MKLFIGIGINSYPLLQSFGIIFLCFSSILLGQVTLTPIHNSPISPAPFELLEPTTNELSYDIDMSPYAGGEDLLFGLRLFEKGATYVASKTQLAYSKSMVARFMRLTEFFLIYFPLNYFISVLQHEVFGHGYRIRNIGTDKVKLEGYDFEFPPPYGDGNATTYFKFYPKRMTTTEFTCISMAAIEAQLILANQVKLHWLETHKIDPRQTILYLVSQYALNLYGSSDTLDADALEGHDLAEYVQFLNLTYPENLLTVSYLKSHSWINLADPFTYYSLFSAFRYLSSGKETRIPMIQIYHYGYLFGAHLGLTPFGPEYYFDNYLMKDQSPSYFYLKGGKHAENLFLGAGCFTPHLFKIQSWSIGVRMDAWRQPKLLLHPGSIPLNRIDWREPPEKEFPLYSKKEQKDSHFGLSASILVSYKPKLLFGMQAELGYKTSGFLPGYSLYPSPVVRISYLATF